MQLFVRKRGASQPKGIERSEGKLINWGMDKTNWEEKAREAFERYLVELKAALPKNANFAMMEQAMSKHKTYAVSERSRYRSDKLRYEGLSKT